MKAEILGENSLIKAKFIYNKFKTNCFSEDTGLEVEALENRPESFQLDLQATIEMMKKIFKNYYPYLSSKRTEAQGLEL